ncbi:MULTISPECIES: hypothetical protein [Pseudonocardia]|uniref:Uncharacterized protein n=2 Tax=Pseudonocardia TaxID=1847 RepID=A0A1Y2MIK6_PSEAH|nr:MULTISPECIES: hypothetical protein [Pseudonocardia]OSY34992.1 hypothetical protein BG845_06375 [Pseudonocardia autotrophica]TDN73198.1 hypothetical protein C8E95_2282 [Pseudonocardia autotrophica]BBG03928.1 hypothetical protein Pdca_51370 [Pseudonocardia autotrophica]GEC28312.1 hypothetical protein PSA01_53410 [Pseudonocardia saturnea]
MSAGDYELLTPGEAVDRLAADLPGGRADAEQVIASYLRDATGNYGRPSEGWRLDEFDLDDARARFGWVDFPGGETVARARARAEGIAVVAVREAAGTSAITDRERLEGLHSDAEMWGYRANPVGLDELTTTAGCEPQPRLVAVGRDGRERSHREATAAHDTRMRAAEAAAEAAALSQHQEHGEDTYADDTDESDCDDEQGRVSAPDHARDDAPAEVETDERGDRERVLDEGPGAFVGGLWFTPDEDADGGVRPLTEAEMRHFSHLVQQSQVDAVAGELDQEPATGRPAVGTTDADAGADAAGWER